MMTQLTVRRTATRTTDVGMLHAMSLKRQKKGTLIIQIS